MKTNLLKKEFAHFVNPDFKPEQLSDSWEDTSWHNDAMPSMINEDLGLKLWVDWVDQNMSDFADVDNWYMFSLYHYDATFEQCLEIDGVPQLIIQTNDFNAVIDCIGAYEKSHLAYRCEIMRLRSLGFTEWNTGGGCTAYGYQFANGHYCLITGSESAMVPDFKDYHFRDITLGLYNADGEAIDCEGFNVETETDLDSCATIVKKYRDFLSSAIRTEGGIEINGYCDCFSYLGDMAYIDFEMDPISDTEQYYLLIGNEETHSINRADLEPELFAYCLKEELI